MGVYELAKDVLKVAQRVDNVELVEKILDLQKGVIDMQDEMLLKSKRINTLEDQIKDLRKQISQKEELILHKGVYWKKDDEQHQQPYCPVCYVNKEVIMAMNKCWSGYSYNQSIYQCPDKSCNTLLDPWEVK